ncbi:pleiotropic drug resistance ABC transporter [Fistulina hepatica ATCC 64428]|uniref:Pleiotropic drug resistance ABC transporter n=1 Tax=Fistulina hepatica ATCC 64428 TaxID=1128425 RepID=A0A0D7A2B7_9AGAR|nr:pleiotropic drug resistance ABC transporter [Fistulina hepatica ATCC 64428]
MTDASRAPSVHEKRYGCRAASLTFSDTTAQGFDFEETLRQVLRGRNKAGLKTRELGVIFSNLSVTGLGSDASYQPTMGSTLNLPRNIFETIQGLRHPQTKQILTDFEGVAQPGEMILVLGNPGAGCSTFLKTIANQRGEYHSMTGKINYDSISPEELEQSFRGDAIYCPEEDIHFPSLTVEQTVRFAAKCRTPQEGQRLGERRDCYENAITDILLTVFGLNHARHTRIGDAMIRGISGGEKKRVSICEALASRACITCWDKCTRGLDSSTALEFVQALRTASDTTRMTVVAALYQAGEPLFRLFDKVCVINEGRMAYFGPTHQARQYFIDLGYEPAHRQTTADFLVSVTDANARTQRAGVPLGVAPRTAAEFAERFALSELGQKNHREVENYLAKFVGDEQIALQYRECAYDEHAKHTSRTSPYIMSIPMQARAVMQRRLQIIVGNPLTSIIFACAHIYQAIIVGTAYFQMSDHTSAFFSRGGALFWALLFPALATMTEIPSLFYQRPIVRRQRNWAWYHPFIDAVALVLVDIPITLITMVFWTAILYFLPGFQISAGQVFTFLLFVFTAALTMKSYFRALSSMFEKEASAQTVGGITVLAFALYTGYLLPVPSMIGALKWINYLDPLRWGFESVITNEFRTIHGPCDQLVPSGPGYQNVSLVNQVCTTVGAVAGQSTVDGSRYMELAYRYSWTHTWMNLGIIIAYGVGFTLVLLLFTELNVRERGKSSVILYNRSQKRKTQVVRQSDEEKAAPIAADNLQETHASNEETDAALARTQPMTDIFTFRNIRYTVPTSQGDRLLLNDVSGYVAPGKLTALMGASGAGKTTLLNVLAERVNVGVVSGERLINGLPLPADFQAQTGYCQQIDTHLGTDTVREALLFSAKLRQPSHVPLSEKEAYVDQLLVVCGLQDCRDAVVGSLGVEQRKRTTIGVELAAKPRLLIFLDEPTSGLDSRSAWGIVSFLRNLADHGQAILCTYVNIRSYLLILSYPLQPSAELFQVFDRLLLLRKGGETVYFGDIGDRASTVIQYFERNGARSCQPDENPAEYMLDVIGAGAAARSTQDWPALWRAAPEAHSATEEISQIIDHGRDGSEVTTVLRHEFATPWILQLKELLRRDLIYHWRDPAYTFGKTMLNILAGLFVGFTFFQTDDSQQGVQSKIMSLFMSMILRQLQVPFINMRDIYEIRERPSRIYRPVYIIYVVEIWSALLLSQILADLAWNILGSSIYFLCWFWTIGFPSSRGGYVYLMLGVLFPAYYTTFGQGVAAMGPTAEIANILFVTLLSFVITFNGVVQPYSQLGWWKWMYRASPFTYIIEGLIGYAVGHSKIVCSDVEFVSLDPPSGQTCEQYMGPYIASEGGYLGNPSSTSACQFCAVDTTDALLGEMFNIYYSHHWRNVGLVCVFIAFNVSCSCCY